MTRIERASPHYGCGILPLKYTGLNLFMGLQPLLVVNDPAEDAPRLAHLAKVLGLLAPLTTGGVLLHLLGGPAHMTSRKIGSPSWTRTRVSR